MLHTGRLTFIELKLRESNVHFHSGKKTSEIESQCYLNLIN